MSQVAIVGAGGFVGLSLVESLVLGGSTDIYPIIRSYRNMAGLCRYGDAVSIRRADAEDVGSLSKALTGARTVVNVTTGPPAGIIRSTSAIYEACLRAGVRRLIHLSSAVVYGDVLAPVVDDDPPLAKHWMPYARAKAASELWLRQRLDDEHVDVVVLRPGIVWGVRSPHTTYIAKALAGKSAYLVDDGRGIFNGIYIANLIACVRACCEYLQRAAGFYNVGDHELVTWREFYDALGPSAHCDPARLPRVSGDHFPWSLGAAIDAVQSLPLVNESYHQLKAHVPDALKATIRNRLEGTYSYERFAASYAMQPAVDRELWHLQRVRHKLPVGKFENTFHFAAPVSFSDGIGRTTAWLATLGLARRSIPAPA